MSAVRLGVSTNSADVSAAFGQLVKVELRKAEAIALTRSGFEGRDAVRASMSTVFTLRARGLLRAVDTQIADVRDNPMSAKVGIRDDAGMKTGFLVQHVTGRIRKPERAKTILVPTRRVQRTASGKIPSYFKPYNLLEEKRGFLTDKILARRVKKERTIRPIFTRHASVRIRATWDFEGIVKRAFEKTFPEQWAREFPRAIARARRRMTTVPSPPP